MATINLGNLTFTHKGDYASGTAYVKNDVVYYATNGNSYIAKTSTTGNAPTSTSHWDLFVAGSGGIWNAGLSLGSANQELRVNSGGNALEFHTPSAGGVLQVKSCQTGSYFSTTSTGLGTSAYDVTDLGLTLTPTSATSHILITGMIHAHHITSYCGRGYITYNHSGISETVIKSSNASGSAYGCTFRFETGASNTSNVQSATPINLHITPNTTNAITFKTRIMTADSSTASIINNTGSQHTNSDDGGHTLSSLTFWEISNGISPAVTNSNVAS